MSTVAPLQNTAAKPQSTSQSPSAELLLQRKCACGGSPCLAGECEACKSKRLQKKLSIGASNDPLEQEADRVADQVLTAPAHSAVGAAPSRIQRFTGQATGDEGTAPVSVDRVLSGSGRPLGTSLQNDMGNRFGYDFSTVRVHTGSAAEQSAREVNAHAYTVRHNIVFGAGRFAPKSHEGRRLLAHELAHVVQQSNILHRQQMPASAAAHTTEWDRLSPDVQSVLQYSFMTRHADEWMWQDGHSAADCFNKKGLIRQRAFRNVISLLKQQGLWLWVERVSEFWARNTQGIRFKPDDREDLQRILLANRKFCLEKWIFGGRKETPKWRQVVRTGTPGLHIVIPRSGLCIAHIDMLAPVEGRESDGRCNYAIFMTGIRHWWKEEKGWGKPIEIPESM